MKTRTPSGIFRFVACCPRTIVFVAILLSVLSVLYTKKEMHFLTGRDQLMPANTSFDRDYRRYQQAFGDQEEIAVVIESQDPQQALAFGTKLQQALLPEKKIVREVFFPGGLPYFRRNGLLFMPLSDLRQLHDNLLLAKPALKAISASPSVQTLFTWFTGEIDGYLQGRKDAPGAAEKLKSITFLLDKMEAGFREVGKGGDAGASMESFFLSGGGDSAFARAARQQILTVLPVKEEGNFKQSEEAVRLVRAKVDLLKKDPAFKGVSVGLTGTPVLEYEEMATSERDITWATAISLVLTVILLILAFRGLVNVAAAMVSLIVAVAISFGAATLLVGHLNILSMVFAVMLIGIGIEYGIQVVLRYQEELLDDAPHVDAIGTGVNRNVWPIVMAAATVAAAFLTFVFTDFRGIAELGIIAAAGIVVCVVVTFTVLPAILLLLAPYRKGRRTRTNRFLRHFEEERKDPRWKTLLFGHPRAVLIATALLCAACIPALLTVKFDYNLMNLQAKGLESVAYAYKLMKSAENSGYFAVVIADSPAQAVEKTRRLEALPSVDHVVSLQALVPDQQQEKLALLADLRRELADVQPAKYEEDLRVMELPTVFENFRNSVVKLKEYEAREGMPEVKVTERFLATLDAFFAALEKEKDRNALGMLRDFQGGMFQALPEKIAALKESLEAAPVTVADVPPQLRSRFVGKHGELLLQVAPKGEIFDREPLERFLKDVRSVDPHATGEPVMVYESMTIMRDAYRQAFIYSFGAIVVILLIAFRSLRFTIIGLVPLVVGILFTVGGMKLLGIDFNSANIIVMPLVLGVAVDSGIYIINRFRRENESPVRVIFSSTGLGVLFNTLTIMASFGALMVAHHQGVFSIGAVMSLGMFACQIAFILVLPAVLARVKR